MATRQRREEDARHVIQPFIDDWRERAGSEWAAFRDFAVGQILMDAGLTDEEIEEATAVDGPADFGIDAWWLAVEESGLTLYLVQAKDTRATKDDLRRLRRGFTDAMDPATVGAANRSVQENAAELHERLTPDLTIEMHLVTSRLVSRNLRTDGQPLDDIDAPTIEIRGSEYPVSYYIHDVESIAQNLSVTPDLPIDARFSIGKNDYFMLNPSGGLRTVSAAIRASELALLYNQNRINLFRENPRYYLGPNKINKDMYRTLDEDPVNFYLYNNGLTATCASVDVAGQEDELSLMMRDFQIVNGCQTTVTIHELWRKGDPQQRLSSVLVPISVIETRNPTTAETVARTTNQQTAMRPEDFRAGNPIHGRLHAEFDRLQPRWYYEYKRGLWNSITRSAQLRRPYEGDRHGVRRIKMTDLAQACLAFLGHPDEASDRVRTYFRREEKHEEVFPPRITAQRLLLPYAIFLEASEMVRDDEAKAKEAEEKREWSRRYLRFPLVAMTAEALRYLLGIGSSQYFSHERSLELFQNIERWGEPLLKIVYEALVDHFNGKDVRSLVRRTEWYAEGLEQVKRRVNLQLQVEQQVAERSGLSIDSVGLRSVLPIVLPSPGG